MAADDAPDHFSWEEIYSLYGIPIVETPIKRIARVIQMTIDEEPSSLGEVGIGQFPPTTPNKAS